MCNICFTISDIFTKRSFSFLLHRQERDKDREKNRNFPSAGLPTKWLHWLGLGQAKGRSLNSSRSPMWENPLRIMDYQEFFLSFMELLWLVFLLPFFLKLPANMGVRRQWLIAQILGFQSFISEIWIGAAICSNLLHS